jgi:ribosomal protein S18 acetylase RimI-like enzyme
MAATTKPSKPLATTASGLTMDYATPADLPGLSELYFRSFAKSHPFYDKMIVSNPHTISWWHAGHITAINDPGTIFLVVRDPQSVPANKVIGLARWVRAAPTDGAIMSDGYGAKEGDEEIERWPEFSDGFDVSLAGPLFGSFESHRKQLVGMRRHYYMELLCTDIEYSRQGAASLMLQYGCDMADAEDVECYVDASPMARPLYERLGFEMRAEERMPDVEGQEYVEKFGVRRKASERK